MTTPVPEIGRAKDELVALACKVRKDWAPDFVDGAIISASNGGMTWEQILVGLPRLMIDPAARPRDLGQARKLPRARMEGDQRIAASAQRGADMARALLDGKIPQQPGPADVRDAQ